MSLMTTGLDRQPLDDFPALQMLADDFVHVFFRLAAVPYAFGINHHAGSQLAAVEAAGGVHTRSAEVQFLHPRFHVIAQLVCAFLGAAAALMAGLAAVGAAEDMGFV